MTRVRLARPEDADAVREVHEAAIRGLAAEEYEDHEIEAWVGPGDEGEDADEGTDDENDEAGPIADDDQYVIVATRDGEIVGFGHLDAAGSEVVADYVHPDVAREGVGSQLLADLEREARDRGLAALELSASLNAVAFYAGAGYERLKRTTHELQAGIEIDCVRMRKELD